MRSLDQIRQDAAGRRTLHHLANVLQAKLELLAQYGAYEYDAGEEGLEECARLFRELAAADRADVDHVIEVMSRMQKRGRFTAVAASHEPRPSRE